MARPYMTFGAFVGPFHEVGENPTLAYERDLELMEWLDTFGFQEAFIGEHHSAGWETIACPEVFIAAAAQRTRHLRFGTGVVSLPYHHPFMVADRIVLLDHLTRGRLILGVGPGALATDAYMMGVDPERQREMMDESLGVIIRLLTETEPITVKTDWFELNEAVLQIRPYQRPRVPIAVASVQSPAGVYTAGKYGAGVLSLSVPRGAVRETSLAELWSIAEASAAEHGQQVRREEWRLSISVHLADSRKQAFEDIREGHARLTLDYYGKTLGHRVPDGVPREQLLEHMVENHSLIVGTPDDCIEAIDRLQEISGGFGGLLIRTEDWTMREKLQRSYELFGRYVMPHYQGSLAGVEQSNAWAQENRDRMLDRRLTALRRATDAYYGEGGDKDTS
jgi:limonene 1,2-monooxygenase